MTRPRRCFGLVCCEIMREVQSVHVAGYRMMARLVQRSRCLRLRHREDRGPMNLARSQLLEGQVGLFQREDLNIRTNRHMCT